jgi:hypothetical protein
MATSKFDILFSGELLWDADRDEVRRRLQQRFKLSDEAASKLFSGGPIVIRRGVDAATARGYREVFRDAGALVQIRQVETESETPAVVTTGGPARGPAVGYRNGGSVESGSASGGLRLATPAKQNEPLEKPGAGNPPDIDVSHLRLVPGQGWTLEDCEPPPESVDIDTSHLGLVMPAPDDREERED